MTDKDVLRIPTPAGWEDAAEEDGKVTVFSMRGYAKFLLLTADSEGGRVRLAKELMAERLLLNGFKMDMLADQVGSNLRILARDARGRLSHYLSGLAANPDAVAPFVDLIFTKGFWSEDDGLWQANETVRRAPRHED